MGGHKHLLTSVVKTLIMINKWRSNLSGNTITMPPKPSESMASLELGMSVQKSSSQSIPKDFVTGGQSAKMWTSAEVPKEILAQKETRRQDATTWTWLGIEERVAAWVHQQCEAGCSVSMNRIRLVGCTYNDCKLRTLQKYCGVYWCRL